MQEINLRYLVYEMQEPYMGHRDTMISSLDAFIKNEVFDTVQRGFWWCLSQGVSAKLHVLKCLQRVEHLGRAVQKSQQTFLQHSPRHILLLSLEFPSFCKSQTCCKRIQYSCRKCSTLSFHLALLVCTALGKQLFLYLCKSTLLV